MFFLLVSIFVISYAIYGIIEVKNNKEFSVFEKTIWILIVLLYPVIGVTTYLLSFTKKRDW